ncbi:hypothetical protein MMC19_004865 [Ptychographa xylographoides]|nr:hypothetical protein [Ptychographa xylographoides]
MSFFRNRLSRFWGSNDFRAEASSKNVAKDTRLSSPHESDCFNDCNSLSRGSNPEPEDAKTMVGILRPAQHDSSSKPSLHKTASSTFKMISDTIRSKARLFYVETERPEIPWQIDEGSDTKQQTRPRILASLRNRSSRARLKQDVEEPTHIASTFTTHIPHELHVDIPSPMLLDNRSNSRLQQLIRVPSNTSAASSSISQHTPEQCSSGEQYSLKGVGTVIVDANHNIPQQTHSWNHPSKSSNAHQVSITAVTEERACANNLGSVEDGNLDHLSSKEFEELISRVSVTGTSNRKHSRGSIFVMGNREVHRKYNKLSPYRIALQGNETLDAISAAATIYPRVLQIFRHSSDSGDPQVRPSISYVARLLIVLNKINPSNRNGIPNRAKTEPLMTSIEGYDADAEYSSEHTAEPSMGPRAEWERARADRQKRYHVVRSMSGEMVNDADNDAGLERRHSKSPSLPDVPRGVADVQPSIQRENSSTSEGVYCRLEAVSDGQSKAGHIDSLEILQIVHPSCNTSLGSPHFQTMVPNTLACSNEAISCASGQNLDIDTNRQVRFPDQPPTYEESITYQATSLPADISIRYDSSRAEPPPRRLSFFSDTTSDGCAITTSSPLCSSSIPRQSNHTHTTPVRRTSSIKKTIHQIHEEAKDKGGPLVTPTKLPVKDLKSRPTPDQHTSVLATLNRRISGSYSPSPEELKFDQEPRIGMGRANKTENSSLDVVHLAQRPLSVDFASLNPEVDHYLAQVFTGLPFSAAVSEYSDEEDSFCTPLATPSNRAQSTKGNMNSASLHVSSQGPNTYRYLGDESQPKPNSCFNAARLPEFGSVNARKSLHRERKSTIIPRLSSSSPVDGTFEQTPESPLVPRIDHTSGPLWQMRDIGFESEDFTHTVVGSAKKQMETSSTKKGVWWTRAQQTREARFERISTTNESPLIHKRNSPVIRGSSYKPSDDSHDIETEAITRIETFVHMGNPNVSDNVNTFLAASYVYDKQDSPVNRDSLGSNSGSEMHDYIKLITEDSGLAHRLKRLNVCSPAKTEGPSIASETSEQDQELHRLVDFFAVSISPNPIVKAFKKLDTPSRTEEKEARMEPNQGEEVVIGYGLNVVSN